MAFKIKSAKIFFFLFFGIKEHTVMLLLVVPPCLSTRCYGTSTERANEALPHPDPAGQHGLRTKVRPGGTAVSHASKENARQQNNILRPRPITW